MLRTLVFPFAALVLIPCAAWPQGNPVGPEFHVNTYTTNGQSYPSIAVGGSGDFVVVWASSNQDGSGYGIFGQRYSGSGSPLGGEFRVNTFTSGQQAAPAVAADAAGNFIVVWQSLLQDGSGEGVFGQRFASNGGPLGLEFRVNSFSISDQRAPSVAADSSGDFVVVWQSLFQDGSGEGVFGQRFATSGVPLGPEFRVNTVTTNPQTDPSVASDSAGNFIVTWQQFDFWGVFGQRFSNSGAPLGPEFRVSSSQLPLAFCCYALPSVASDSSGNFVVVWQLDMTQYPTVPSIIGRRFSNSGAPLGPNFFVNTYQPGSQQRPSVSADGSGNFVVIWGSFQDGSNFGVFGQRYASNGTPLGPEFRVNTYTTMGQDPPAAAADALGNFVVTWMSAGQDGSAHGIFAQRYNRIVPVELLHFQVE